MLTLEMKSPEAYQATDEVVHMNHEDLEFLRRAIHKSSRRRSRICTHRSVGDGLHEMFVIYSDSTYVRPNRHLGKDESVLVLQGEADFLFFDDRGSVTDIVRMGDPTSGRPYYCRVPQGLYHTIIMRTPEVLLFEATPGPFDPADTFYAEWAPTETDEGAVAAYRRWMNTEIRERGDGLCSLIGLEHSTEYVYTATDPVVTLSKSEEDFLRSLRSTDHLDRVRICVHKTGDDRLHEMLMTFAGTTYIRPSLHRDKEESLYILDGLGTYVFFDDAGSIADVVPLGPAGSGRSFYCRVPANTYHSLVVESDDITVKETTSGPFRRSDTVFANWSPDGTAADAAREYVGRIRSALSAKR